MPRHQTNVKQGCTTRPKRLSTKSKVAGQRCRFLRQVQTTRRQYAILQTPIGPAPPDTDAPHRCPKRIMLYRGHAIARSPPRSRQADGPEPLNPGTARATATAAHHREEPSDLAILPSHLMGRARLSHRLGLPGRLPLNEGPFCPLLVYITKMQGVRGRGGGAGKSHRETPFLLLVCFKD